jgi:membrane protease YdiL (CAAX protease family)
MPPEQLSIPLVVFNLAILSASVAAIAFVIRRLIRGEVLIPFTPRDPNDAGGIFTWLRNRVYRVTETTEIAVSAPVATQAETTAYDIEVGLIGFLTVLLPVVAVQSYLTTYVVEYEHPLIDQVKENPSLNTFFSATIVAVILAPVLEEFAFRNLLQGGLEVLERRLVGADSTERRWTLGWAPILVSSALFALMHVNHGPAAVPLFLYALMLGYLYFRTHRLLPSIVAHAALNAFSMVQLWFLQ